MRRPAAYAPARIALTALVVLALMALGLVAGKWQWGRYETKKHASDAYHAAQGLPAVTWGSLPAADRATAVSLAWRTVTLTGTLDADSVVALRGRSVEGSPALEYLAWLTTADGTSVIVNLGWQPREDAQTPSLPADAVTVTGVVRTLESDNGKTGTRITPAQMPPPHGEALDVYVMASSTCAGTECIEELETVPLPEISLGPHLSYAMQWWLLTVSAAPLGIWLTRRDAQLERERTNPGAPTAERAATTPVKPRRKRQPTDEEIEDAL